MIAVSVGSFKHLNHSVNVSICITLLDFVLIYLFHVHSSVKKKIGCIADVSFR